MYLDHPNTAPYPAIREKLASTNHSLVAKRLGTTALANKSSAKVQSTSFWREMG